MDLGSHHPVCAFPSREKLLFFKLTEGTHLVVNSARYREPFLENAERHSVRNLYLIQEQGLG